MGKAFLFIVLLAGSVPGFAQGCIESLEKAQFEFYQKNKPFVEYKRIYDSAYREITGPGKRIMDSLEALPFSVMTRTKYDLIGIRPYYNLLLSQLFGSSYFTDEIKKKICIGGIPAKNFNAFAEARAEGSAVVIDLLLSAYIAPLVQVGALCRAYDSLPYKLEALRKRGDPGFKWVNEKVPVVKSLDSIMTFYSAEDWITPPTGPAQSSELFALEHGCELFILAHECAHTLLQHSGAEILRSQVWKQELDADWLGQKIFEDAVLHLPNEAGYKRNMKMGSVLALVIFSILERESFYQSAKIDVIKEQFAWLPKIADYIMVDQKSERFNIDVQINVIPDEEYLRNPPVIVRADHLIRRIRQEGNYDNEILQFIIKMGADLNLIWMLSKSGFYK